MLMSTDEFSAEVSGDPSIYPELAGKRVLITGISGRIGVDIARAFAEHRARLILQFDEAAPEMDAVAEMLAPMALEMTVRAAPLSGTDEVVQYARAAAQTYGGLDVVVNLVPVALPQGTAAHAEAAAVEASACELLTRPCLVARIAANRMRLTHTEGLILTVALLPDDASATDRAFASVMNSAIAAMTRTEAQEWSTEAIRFNSVAPAVGGVKGNTGVTGEVEVAALALFLASSRGKHLSGHIFEAAIGGA